MQSGILVSSIDLRPSLMSILKGLKEQGLLRRVVTTVAIDSGRPFGRFASSIGRFLPLGLKRGIQRKSLPDFLSGQVDLFYSREILRLLAKGMGSEALSNRLWLWAELGFDRKVANRYAGVYRCIYGMEHGCEETFSRQKKLGGSNILRQVMAHGGVAVEVIKREIDKFPEYAGYYGHLFRSDIKRSLMRKKKEYELADLIVTNSAFVKDTFVQSGVRPDKIVAIPTGCPGCCREAANAGRGGKPLIFLFVGRLSLRKGLPYLIQAWHSLKPKAAAELWLVGEREIPEDIFKGQNNQIRLFGALPASELAAVYRQADVLVLPTLLEGLAYVVLEALACGLPIITTRESGCGDLVQNGDNGFIIEAANTESLSQAMAWCLENRGKLALMGGVSMEKARGWTVVDSNRAHLEAIQEFLRTKGSGESDF